MITAETITDEQIREVAVTAVRGSELEYVCEVALDPPDLLPRSRRRARARCAVILNASSAAKP